MLAMMLTSPPHSLQVAVSISKTRFNLCAQVMDARRSAGVCSCLCSVVIAFFLLPRLASVTNARNLLLGAPKVGTLGEHPVKAGEVYSWLGYLGNQSGDKI